MAVKPDTSFVVGETCIYDENDPILEYVAKCGIVARNTKVQNGIRPPV